jgi:hypothetical protein
MPSRLRLPPWLLRLNPMPPLLAAVAEVARTDTAKAVEVPDEDGFEFGSIAAATSASSEVYYTVTTDEDFVIGAGLGYTGDDGAFQVYAGPPGAAAASPIALTSGMDIVYLPIPPSTAPNYVTLTIRALAANDGVAKAGTLTIYDRFDFANDGGAPTRTLKTLALSKTYEAP